MEKKVIQAGFAGSGFAAKFHYDGLQGVRGVSVEVTGAYSKTPSRMFML
ncbi:MAG: hypothetical protein KAS71_17490 [Bacteroidales bacterium]|nr:hypothetical protein [Bacteroidales bacterium]